MKTHEEKLRELAAKKALESQKDFVADEEWVKKISEELSKYTDS